MRAFMTILILLGMFCLGASPALAATAPVSLEALVREALVRNPTIQAARARADAATARIPQAKALPDPMAGVAFENVPIDTGNPNRGDMITYRLQQDFPFPGKRWVRGRAARADAQAAARQMEGVIFDVVLDLQTTYYELYRLDRALAVNRETQALFRQLVGSTETGYAAGQTTVHVPLKAHVELATLRNEAVRLGQQHIAHVAHLQALLARPSHAEVRIPTHLTWPRLQASLATLQTLAHANRPELRELSALEARDTTRVTQARQTLIPDFSFTVEYNQRPAMQDAWTGMAMVNLPLYFWGRQRGAIREARAMVRATAAERRAAEIHTIHEIEAAYSAVQATATLMATYARDLLPQARTALAATQTAYAAQAADFLTLIDAARTLKELQTAYADTQADYGIARATLERVVGSEVD